MSSVTSQEGLESNLQLSGSTLASPQEMNLETAPIGDLSVFEDGTMDRDLLKAMGSELQEPSSSLKREVQLVSPLTPQRGKRPQSPLFHLEPSLSAPKIAESLFEFPADLDLKNPVLSSLMSLAEGETVEATLSDIRLDDINPSRHSFEAPGGAENAITDVKQEKTIAVAAKAEIDSGSTYYKEGSNTFTDTSVEHQGKKSILPGDQEFLDGLMELDFCFDGSSLQEVPPNLSSILETKTIRPFPTSSKEVMARAAAAVASGACDDRERPWACELCPSSFSIKGHLSQHNRYVHEKYRPHQCLVKECDASFGTRFARSQHIWTVHERKKPFACDFPQCDASFGQRSHLNRHRKRHSRPNTKGTEGKKGAAPDKNSELSSSIVKKSGSLGRASAAKISPTVVAAAAEVPKSLFDLARNGKRSKGSSAAIAGTVASHVASHLFGQTSLTGETK